MDMEITDIINKVINMPKSNLTDAMKAERLQTLFDAVKDINMDEIEEGGGVKPKVFIAKGGIGFGVLIPETGNPSDISLMANAAMQRLQPDFAIFTSEAWAVDGMKEKDIIKIRPSKHPDRIEIVLLIGAFDGYVEMLSFRAIKDGNRTVDLEDFHHIIHTSEAAKTSVYAKCFDGVFKFGNIEDTIGETWGNA